MKQLGLRNLAFVAAERELAVGKALPDSEFLVRGASRQHGVRHRETIHRKGVRKRDEPSGEPG
jgi:hypothetical protein